MKAALGHGLEHLIGFFRLMATNDPHWFHRQGLAAHQHHHIDCFLKEGDFRVLVLEVKAKITERKDFFCFNQLETL